MASESNIATAGVGRQYRIDHESGRESAEPGKTMADLAAPGLSHATTTLVPRGSGLIQHYTARRSRSGPGEPNGGSHPR